MINSLDDAITHCLEVAEEQDKLATRYEDASGYSRTHIESLRTNESIKCRECAKEHRQLADWLRELKAYREFADWLVKAVLEEDWEDSSDFYAEVLCRKLTKLGKLKVVDNKYVEVNADE